MSRKLFKEDISKYRQDLGCIPRSARAYYDMNTNTIDLKKWKKENPDDYNEWKKTAVKCNSDFYGNENSEGCCYNENENTECLTKDNNTGLKFLGNEDIGEIGKVGNICHKEEVQNLYNTLFDDPNNIKIVHFTATPDSLLNRVDIWQNSLKVLRMQVPEKYVSVEKYFEKGQIFDCKPLIDSHDNIRHLLEHIDLADPFYHIIRTPRGLKHHDLIHDFRTVFNSFDFQYISEPSYRKNRDFYSLLHVKPNKHTFIFIIDKLRCAKSISLNFLQICYDRFVDFPSYDSVAQGLLGRCTGYHSNTLQIRIFTFKHLLLSQHNLLYYTNILHPF